MLLSILADQAQAEINSVFVEHCNFSYGQI